MPQTAFHARRTIVLIWVAAIVLIVLGWWRVAVLIDTDAQRERQAATRDLANITRLMQEHASRTFQATDQVNRFIQSRYEELGSKLDLVALSDQGVIETQIFPQVGIIDAKGIYILSNKPITSRIDLSDREHFQVHVQSDKDRLFVSKPVLGRASGKWSIQLTRRISDKRDRFNGVVVVSIATDYFTRFYRELNLGTQGLIALYGLDGVARVRKVGSVEDFGTSAANAPMFERMARGESEGSYTNLSVVDGVERLFYFRRIPGYALAVVAGYDMKALMDRQQNAKQALWLQAGAVSALILALAFALTRYLWLLRQEFDQRQLAQRQIEDRNEQLNAIFELSPDGFVTFDAQRRVKYVSPAFKVLTHNQDENLEGLTEEDFSNWLAQRCKPVKPFIGVAALRARMSRETPDPQETVELGLSTPRVLRLGLRLNPGQTVSQILYLRDITIESEVDRMKSEFLATAAHELRTPMASVYGYAELLLMDDIPAETQKLSLQTIYNQAQLMANILNELLDLARIEARRDKDFRYTRVHLQTLLPQIIRALVRPVGREPPMLGIPSEDLDLMADVGKLSQALSNVLSNAYKYSLVGGFVLVKAYSALHPSGSPGVAIEVIDSGIGMTPEQTTRVCERFYRADSSGKIPGTGLGMSIVKEIVELHRGNLQIQSELGKGTTVRMWFPTYATHPAQLHGAVSSTTV